MFNKKYDHDIGIILPIYPNSSGERILDWPRNMMGMYWEDYEDITNLNGDIVI